MKALANQSLSPLEKEDRRRILEMSSRRSLMLMISFFTETDASRAGNSRLQTGPEAHPQDVFPHIELTLPTSFFTSMLPHRLAGILWQYDPDGTFRFTLQG